MSKLKADVEKIFGPVSDYREDAKQRTVTFNIGTGGFKFDELMALTKALGTTHIEWYSRSIEGCPTCGPDNQTDFDAYDVVFPTERER